MFLTTHLTVLDESASAHSFRAAFRIPKLVGTDGEEVEEWETITYARFHEDVDRYARYWASVLAEDGLPSRSVVSLW